MSHGAKLSDSVSENTADPTLDMKIDSTVRNGTVVSGYTIITKSMIGAGMVYIRFSASHGM